MNWFKFFRMVGSSKRPFSKTSSPRHRLALETLESREVPATPTVTSVVPTTGALTPLDPTTGNRPLPNGGPSPALNKQQFASHNGDAGPGVGRRAP